MAVSKILLRGSADEGLMESSAGVTGQPADLPPRYGYIGKCLWKSVAVKIFDENDQELPSGQVGEQGPTVMKGYWNAPEEIAAVLKDGWLHIGDVSYMDEDDYFYITDRKKDIIIRRGGNVSPAK